MGKLEQIADKKQADTTTLEERPDDIPESLWILLHTLKEDIKGEIKALDSKVSALIRLNGELKENVTSLEQIVELLGDRLIRTDTLNKRLQSRILDLETRSMRNNIIFSFDPKSSDFGTEAEGENCVLIIKHFLGSVLSIPHANDVYIPVAHRLGIRRTGTSRQIIATFPVANELHMVLQH